LRRFDLEHTFLLQGSPDCRAMLHRAHDGELLQHISLGVGLVVAAALTLAVSEHGPWRNTCGVTAQCRSIADLVKPGRHPVCPGLDPRRRIRLFKQVLGWTAPKVRDPEAADRWTWLITTCHAQLRLARRLAADLRRPWERPAPPGRLTPARVRRGFRNIHAKTTRPAAAPKPGKPGPGRPPGSKNRRPAPRYDVGKTTKRELTLKAREKQAG